MRTIDFEIWTVLEALDQGVVPTELASKELVSMGLLEPHAGSVRMTAGARLRLEELRAERTHTLRVARGAL